jgi:hypothetical protein
MFLLRRSGTFFPVSRYPHILAWEMAGVANQKHRRKSQTGGGRILWVVDHVEGGCVEKITSSHGVYP